MRTQLQHAARDAGFTLVEIMVVVVILGLLATLVVQNVIPIGDTARETKALTDVMSIGDAVRLYRTQNGRLPTMRDLVTPDARGRVAIEDLSQDPWGNDYVVREGVPPRTFEVRSAGPDGELDTADDISTVRDGGS